MFKTEFFQEEFQCDLENEVNRFIKDKKVVNVSYTYDDYHCCCVLYEV